MCGAYNYFEVQCDGRLYNFAFASNTADYYLNVWSLIIHTFFLVVVVIQVTDSGFLLH